MPNHSFPIELTSDQVATLNNILKDDSASSKVKLRAKVLLLSDVNLNTDVSILKIAKELETSRQTVTKIRNIYRDQGFDIALHELKHHRTADSKCYNEDLIAHVKSILLESPVSPRKRWSIRALCDECMARGYIEYISPYAMHRLLHFNNIEL